MESNKTKKYFETIHISTQARWIYTALIVFVGMISKFSGVPNISFPFRFMLILFLVSVINNSYWYLFRYFHSKKNVVDIKQAQFITFIQYLVDLLAITIIIHFAGGIESISFIFYFFVIIASSFAFSQVGVFAITFTAALLYNFLIFSEYFGIIKTYPRYNFSDLTIHYSLDVVLVNIFTVSTVIFMSAFFIGYLSKLRKRQEEKIVFEKEERIREEKKIDEIRSRFVTVLSHQFRTPLTHIKLVLSSLSEFQDCQKNEKAKLIAEASISLERALALIDRLVKIRDLESKNNFYDLEKIELGKIIKEAVIALKSAAAKKKMEISFSEIKENARKTSAYYVKGNYGFILTAVEILIENAITYGKPNSIVKVAISKINNNYEISVTNQGQGILRKDRNKIFSLFYRTDKALRAETDHSGLSLYLAKIIIKKHKGKISFVSIPQKETSFFIQLPILNGSTKKVKKDYRQALN